MFFADDINLLGESREGGTSKLELWRQTLKTKCFKLSIIKTEYMHYKFGDSRRQISEVTLDRLETLDRVEIETFKKF